MTIRAHDPAGLRLSVFGVSRDAKYTSSREVAEIAKKTRPGLLILYHRAKPGGVGPNPEQGLLEEVHQL